MRTIGLLGGMSWESTSLYYRLINESVKRRLGGLHSARLAMVSIDFHSLEALQRAGDWDAAGIMLADAARQVEAAGAECVLICANTMHKVLPAVEAAVSIPVLHVVDATAAVAKEQGCKRLGLLGTRFTMEGAFYCARFADHFGLDIIIPPEDERVEVHRVIYEELCQGVVSDASRQRYLEIIGGLASSGAEAIIAGCTEIGLLVQAQHTSMPLYDTTRIHAEAAVSWALAAGA